MIRKKLPSTGKKKTAMLFYNNTSYFPISCYMMAFIKATGKTR